MLAYHTPAPMDNVMILNKTLNWHEKQGRAEYRRFPMHLTAELLEVAMFDDDGIRQLLKDGVKLVLATVGAYKSILIQLR